MIEEIVFAKALKTILVILQARRDGPPTLIEYFKDFLMFIR